MISVYTIQAGTVFVWFILVMVIRHFVMLVIASVEGYNKPSPSDSRVLEDRILRSPDFTKDIHACIHVNNTINNDSENDTYSIILLLATAVFSDHMNGDCTRTIVYGVIYSFTRIFYAIAYIAALQPWRSIAFYFGLACTLACNLDLVITMSRRPN